MVQRGSPSFGTRADPALDLLGGGSNGLRVEAGAKPSTSNAVPGHSRFSTTVPRRRCDAGELELSRVRAFHVTVRDARNPICGVPRGRHS